MLTNTCIHHFVHRESCFALAFKRPKGIYTVLIAIASRLVHCTLVDIFQIGKRYNFGIFGH